jgi:RHS repeat-associated protein
MVLGQNPASNCASADTTLMRLFMGYGAANNGNLDSQDIAADGFLVRQNYTYDKLNRLETAIEATLPTAGSTGWKQTNGYDRWGNRWVSDLPADTYPANLTAQANSSSWFTAKNRLNLLGGFDNAGNQTSANGFTLSYDAENRLTTAVHGTNTSKNQAYSYDAEGRRVKQVSGTSPVTLTTYFVYDAMGGLAAEYEVKTGEYPTPAAQCTTCYLAQDHLGSTRALWDDTGVKARFDYLPYGEAIPGDRNGRGALTCAAGVTNCYNGPGSLTQKFTGKERDAETGLDYFGARYMSAAQGRFTSPDPKLFPDAVYDPQSWNKYGYVRNNPLRLVDPDGEDWKDVAGGFLNAFNTNQVLGIGRTAGGNSDFRTGQAIGDAVSTIQGTVEALIGGGGEAGGLALDATGVGAVAGIPLNVASAGVIAHGVSVAGVGLKNLGNAVFKAGTEGTYEFPDAKSPGKTYVGQSGNVEGRLGQHGKSGRLGPGTDPKVTPVKGGKTAREVAEQKRINELGGTKNKPGSQTSNDRNPIGKKREKKIEDEYGSLKD